MTLLSTNKTGSMLAPIGGLLVSMVSIQMGAALAKHLFPLVGASGTTALRLAFAAILLLAVWRPWHLRPSAREVRTLVSYGVSMGLMNFCFYLSLSRIPLGIAVALEFTGPLALSMATSRRVLDFVWIGLAALGLIVLLPWRPATVALDAVGVGFALASGLFWAIYIVFGQKAGHAHGGQTAALGTTIAALVIAPFGIASGGMKLLSLDVLPVALGLALLASALPYSLEMYALMRIPTRTFGVLMSLEPALAALSGLIFLGESLHVIQWSAVACIMAASAGSALTSRTRLAALAD